MAELSFHYGVMSCGKSTYVLQLRHTLESEGFKPVLVKPSFDTRDEKVIRSRIGIEFPAHTIGPNEDTHDWLAKWLRLTDGDWTTFTHIIVDEAQFLSDKNIDGLRKLVDKRDIQVYCFGLRTAYTGRLFDATAYLMAIADNLVELPMVYKDGSKANMHIRYVDGKPIFDGNATFVGDIDEEYESVSRREYFSRREDWTTASMASS